MQRGSDKKCSLHNLLRGRAFPGMTPCWRAKKGVGPLADDDAESGAADRAEPGTPGGPRYISAELAGQLLMIGAERVRQLRKEGWIPADGRGRFTVPGSVQGYIRYLQSRINAAKEADNRLRAEKLKREQLRLAREEGELIPFEAVKDLVLELQSSIRDKLISMPSRITRDLAERQKIEAEIDKVLDEVADSIEEYAAARAHAGSIVSAEPEAIAG